jgi:hypothetical protein
VNRHPDVETALQRWRYATFKLAGASKAIKEEELRKPIHDGAWTKRDLLAHLATGYVRRIAWLERALAGEDPNVPIDIERANADNVPRLSGLWRYRITSEMLRQREYVQSLLERLQEDHLRVPIRRDTGEVVPLREVVLDLSAHDLEHLTELTA